MVGEVELTPSRRGGQRKDEAPKYGVQINGLPKNDWNAADKLKNDLKEQLGV